VENSVTLVTELPCVLLSINFFLQVQNGVLRSTPRESSLDVEITVPVNEGRFRITCREPTNELASNGYINVVDSAALSVKAVSPSAFLVGAETQVNISINMRNIM
jgi:hypothetical protein